VVDRVTNGKGAMPSFSGQLSPTQIADVAAYVSQAAGS
jgi:mono/diheme cytochrome c family protein